MTKITITFEDEALPEDEPRTEGIIGGLRFHSDDLEDALKAQESSGELSGAALMGLTIARQFQAGALQVDLPVWCRDVIQMFKMREAQKNAVNAQQEMPTGDNDC